MYVSVLGRIVFVPGSYMMKFRPFLFTDKALSSVIHMYVYKI
jgi:hypothetical protein